MSLRDLLAPLVEIFKTENIGYAIIGGYGVAAWGDIRGTVDVDIFCEMDDLEKLKAALSKSHVTFEHRRGDRDDPVQHVIRITAPSSGAIGEIDILAGIANAPADVIARSRPAKVDDMSLHVAAPEDMIILKLLAGSPLDLQDAASISRRMQGAIDLALLRNLCPAELRATLDQLIESV